MPRPASAVESGSQRRHAVAAALRALLPATACSARDEELRPYECDGLSVFRQQPMLVVLPRDRDAAARSAAGMPPPRGAGGRPRRGHRPVGRRHAARLRRGAVAGTLRPHSGDRCAGAHRARPARRAQSGGVRGGRRLRSVLRARPLVADRLHASAATSPRTPVACIA